MARKSTMHQIPKTGIYSVNKGDTVIPVERVKKVKKVGRVKKVRKIGRRGGRD